MPKVQNSNEPWSREIYAKPLYTFERGGSEVLFDTKTFKCVYVNFCSIGILISKIFCGAAGKSLFLCLLQVYSTCIS